MLEADHAGRRAAVLVVRTGSERQRSAERGHVHLVQQWLPDCAAAVGVAGQQPLGTDPAGEGASPAGTADRGSGPWVGAGQGRCPRPRPPPSPAGRPLKAPAGGRSMLVPASSPTDPADQTDGDERQDRVVSSTSDATVRDAGEGTQHAGIPLRCVRAVCGRWETFLHTLKAGPPGARRATRRGPHRIGPAPGYAGGQCALPVRPGPIVRHRRRPARGGGCVVRGVHDLTGPADGADQGNHQGVSLARCSGRNR
jgi:hypothetical protein